MEAKLADLEGADAVLAFASGMAAEAMATSCQGGGSDLPPTGGLQVTRQVEPRAAGEYRQANTPLDDRGSLGGLGIGQSIDVAR